MITTKKYKTVAEYFADLSRDKARLLEELRDSIIKAAPLAEELISYNMPAFKCGGMLAYYAAFNNHIGFYPTANAVEYFKADLKKYKTSKGAIQFQVNEELPVALIMKIIRYNLKENGKKKNQAVRQ